MINLIFLSVILIKKGEWCADGSCSTCNDGRQSSPPFLQNSLQIRVITLVILLTSCTDRCITMHRNILCIHDSSRETKHLIAEGVPAARRIPIISSHTMCLLLARVKRTCLNQKPLCCFVWTHEPHFNVFMSSVILPFFTRRLIPLFWLISPVWIHNPQHCSSSFTAWCLKYSRREVYCVSFFPCSQRQSVCIRISCTCIPV